MSIVKQTKEIELFGHVWKFSTNDMLAECQRRSFEWQAETYVKEGMVGEKLASRNAASQLLRPYFGDILSSIETIDGKDDLIIDLALSPKAWVDFFLPFWFDGKGAEIRALHDAAKSVNPDWQEESPVEDAPEESKETLEHPENHDSETLQATSEEIADHAESKAKKKA